MIPTSFEYVKADSVQDAVNLLAQHGSETKLLAGGHSLIPAMKFRLSAPHTLVDISGISELNGIHQADDRLEIGAFVTHAMVESSRVVQDSCAVLSEAAAQIGDPLVRNRGTIGGSLAHADPAADYPALVLALGAEIHVAGPAGDRIIAADDFFTGLFETALNEGEVITKVSFPTLGKGQGAAYEKFAHPASRFAVVGVAAIVTLGSDGQCENARVAITGAAAHAFRATEVETSLVGAKLDATAIKVAAGKAADPANMLGDLFASEDYRAHLCTVLTARAINRAVTLAA